MREISNSPVNDPLELLTNKLDREPRFLSNVYNPVLTAASGFGLAMIMNWGFQKPIFSGVQKHIGFTGVGLLVGIYIDKLINQGHAKRDAVLRNYIELHREDFPNEQRKKYADVLEAWVPIR